MKKIIVLGVFFLLVGGYCVLLLVVCQMVSGKIIEYLVNVSQVSINFDVSDFFIGFLLYSYGGMIIINNECWEIVCSGSEFGGFQSIGGFWVGLVGDGKLGDIYSIDCLLGIGYSFQMGEQDGINFDFLFMVWFFVLVFFGQCVFQVENKKLIIYFWWIVDNGGLLLLGEYCFNDYFGDIYFGGVQVMCFSVSGFCIQVKLFICKIIDDSKNINVFFGWYNKIVFIGFNSIIVLVFFNINLMNCENVGSVFMQFNVMVDSVVVVNEVIKIDD